MTISHQFSSQLVLLTHADLLSSPVLVTQLFVIIARQQHSQP